MNIHEYQAKEILDAYGIPVPRGRVALTSDQVERASKEMGGRCVLKAQIYAGGRGKAGGIKVAASSQEAFDAAKQILGMTLVTKQTGPAGKLIRKVWVEKATDIVRELYVAVVLDRAARGSHLIRPSLYM